jgi:O-antigen ligase
MFAIASGVMLILYLFSTKKAIISVDNIQIGWTLTLLVVLISMLMHDMDQFYLLFYIVCIAFLFLYGNNTLSWAEWSIKLIAFMGLFYAAFTILQVAMPTFYTTNIAPMMNSNMTFDPLRFMRFGIYSGFTYQTAVNAMYLSMGIGASFTLYLFTDKKKWTHLVPIVLEIICILLSAKRGHIIFSLMSLLFVAFANSARSKKFGNVLKIVVAVFALLMLAYYFIPSANYFFEHTLNFGDDITNGRIDRYLPALEMFKEHPILGIGWEQFRYQFNSYSDVHNIYLQLLCETGVIGAGVFIATFIVTLVETIKQLNVSLKQSYHEERRILSFSLYGQIFFLLYGLTGNGLYDYYILFFYMVSVMMMLKTRRVILSLGVAK